MRKIGLLGFGAPDFIENRAFLHNRIFLRITILTKASEDVERVIAGEWKMTHHVMSTIRKISSIPLLSVRNRQTTFSLTHQTNKCWDHSTTERMNEVHDSIEIFVTIEMILHRHSSALFTSQSSSQAPALLPRCISTFSSILLMQIVEDRVATTAPSDHVL
jgi:hypothetical protein